MNCPSRLLQMACLLWLLVPATLAAQQTRNVFLITTDGLRWQEVFNGAEESLLRAEKLSTNAEAAVRAEFWRETPEARRAALMPFLWSRVSARGQIFGNQAKGSIARVGNPHHFSYPGYSEFLTGVVDARIDSNDKRPNPNTNVFEWLNLKTSFKGRVAAACNWEVISWILNTERSQIPIWTGYEPMPGSKTLPVPGLLLKLRENTTPVFADVVMDSFIGLATKEYVRERRPRAFYLAFGETDEWAHQGKYSTYLRAVHLVDRWIQELWDTVQAIPQYRDKTTFIISTDHGRGLGPEWTSHGAKVAGSEFIWMAVLGPDTQPLGERQNTPVLIQGQIAATIAAAVGEDFHGAFPLTAAPILEAVRQH